MCTIGRSRSPVFHLSDTMESRHTPLDQTHSGGSDMAEKTVELIGVPVDAGAGRRGCVMGPAALRVAGIEATFASLGFHVIDGGDVAPVADPAVRLSGQARNPGEIAGWTRAIEAAAYRSLRRGAFPVFLGGDHSLSMGSVSGVA